LLILQGFAEIVKRIAALRGEFVINTHYERMEQ
jgi:TRAP-type mannitol/chloroaromatic compound transport system permease small subunit